MNQEIIKGYKVTNPDLRCKDFLFEVGKDYQHEGQVKHCSSGFHFCLEAMHCFNYYSFDKSNRVFEIEAWGNVITEGDKSVASNIKLVRELSWQEVLSIVNIGVDNTGLGNTGGWNTGDRNTGYRNTGDWNTGDRNTGDRNTGYRNTGDWNTGDRNTGDRNTGDWNTGGWNTGDRNTGGWNTGGWNTGDRNTGGWNTGDRNTGDRNTGDRNTGDRNTGDRNTGDRNTGDWNTGDRNTGDWNTGDRNTGYSNTGDRNTGAFCTGEKTIKIFNKDSEWTIKDFENSRAFNLLYNVNTKIWIESWQMTDEEKEKHPSHKTCEGYLRDIPFKEAFSNMWHNLNEEDKKAFTSLPNFDSEIFEQITSVKI
jgi:PPE-repeat protein